jgi:homoserine dehydrogenase
VQHLEKKRDVGVPPDLLTTNAAGLIADPDVDLVIECIGGTGAAREFVEQALELRKHVVSANKDLLATDGPRLFALAAHSGVTLQYEAAVGGGVPVVRALSESLAGEEVLEVAGIMNGTTNFILSAMHDGRSYAEALAEAQAFGFAESDPANDVLGFDATHKLAILGQLAFRAALVSPRIPRRGITHVSADDIARAEQLDCVVKLVACARRDGDAIAAETAPVFVPRSHPFALPQGAENCVRLVGRSSGPLMFFGLGAGRYPSASAVIGDIIAALRSIGSGRGFVRHHAPLRTISNVTPAFEKFELVPTRDAAYARWSDDAANSEPAQVGSAV